MNDGDQDLKEWLLTELSSSKTARSPILESKATVPPEVPDHTLFRRVGKGSYGEVWLARSVLGVWRAVKVVYRRSFDHARPFERELEGIRRFEPVSRSHPSQLNVLHVGRNDAAGYFWETAKAPRSSMCKRGKASFRSYRPKGSSLLRRLKTD